jgi:hypothetical protein
LWPPAVQFDFGVCNQVRHLRIKVVECLWRFRAPLQPDPEGRRRSTVSGADRRGQMCSSDELMGRLANPP